jgi:hypothetical protein
MMISDAGWGNLDGFIGRGTYGPPRGFNHGVYPTKKLREAVRLRGKVVRLHEREYFWSGENFFKTFEDGPWKWSAQTRFAAKDINTGHFFALTEAGAIAEANFYGVDQTKLGLLELEVDLDAVLDLTKLGGLNLAFEENVKNPSFFDEHRHRDEIILNEMIDIEKGGSVLTDRIGYWAVHCGYDGILFFGARANRPNNERHVRLDNGFVISFASELDLWRDDTNRINLVVFQGSNLIRSVISYTMKPDVPRTENIYFGWPEEKLDSLLGFNSDYQAEQGRYTLYPIEYEELR